MNEKRYFSRLNSQFNGEIQVSNKIYPCKLIDISLKGALLQINENIEELGIKCIITIFLAGENNQMIFNAILVHREGEHFGFKFESQDRQSMIHLRRFLELNLGDSEQIIEELFFLVNPGCYL